MRPLSEKERTYLDKRNSVQRRLSPIIARGNFFVVPNLLLFRKKLGLEFSDFYFICYILSKKWDKDHPYFSMKKIPRDLGENESTLHNSKNRLVKLGYLKVIPKKGDNPQGKNRNIYDITPLLDIIDDMTKKGVHRSFKDQTKANREEITSMRNSLKESFSFNKKTIKDRDGPL